MRSMTAEVLDALGGSILYDEYKGDFGRARQTAQELLDRALERDRPGPQADAWLGRGVVHLLQGEPSAASDCWEQVRRLSPGDPARLLLASCYAALTARLQQLLDRALDLYTRADDPAGMAGCWMIAGDWQCAPATTPLVWNHFVQEGALDSILPQARERAELDRTGLKPEQARRAYDAARELFRAASAGRGLAALELRYGYLRMLDDDYDGVIEHACRAEELFAGSGDLLGCRLACVHRALGRIGAPARSPEAGLAESIGTWGAREGSFAFALGLGLLFTRVGRRWLAREGDYERALVCQRQARALSENLGAFENATQSLIDQGGTYQVAGEHDAALAAFEAAREEYAVQLTRGSAFATALWQKAVEVADRARTTRRSSAVSKPIWPSAPEAFRKPLPSPWSRLARGFRPVQRFSCITSWRTISCSGESPLAARSNLIGRSSTPGSWPGRCATSARPAGNVSLTTSSRRSSPRSCWLPYPGSSRNIRD